ncbi:MAG TPA: helicase-exonuclease AddAB subunit AddA [Tepidisphaeraceae bacterium]|jgi:ATP-dependent helicase/nuclease subunit A|nr:helicase-exonuclease AddAB subunit AddA [Tepidisphaeraceae bacterium]
MGTNKQWTKEQLEAIRTTGTGLLVSAAAGSGKTSVLAERCAYLVCDANPRCNVSQLLVVTFTEAAAAEMKSRIEGTLRKRIAESGMEDPHLRRQLKLIEHANVSTLHGFCSRLLRQHFHRVGLDPNFAILDGDQAALLRVETVRQVFSDRYEAGEADFMGFVDAYGGGNDQRLMDLVLQTHELLCSVIEPGKWMKEAERRIEEGMEKPLEESELGRTYLASVRKHLAGLRERCVTNLEAMPGEFPKFGEYLRGLLEMLESWSEVLEKRGYDALTEGVAQSTFARLPSYGKDLPNKEMAAELVTGVRDQMKAGGLGECLTFSGEEWQETLWRTLPPCRIFLSLVAEFGERYAAAKREARGLDFADLERFTLNLLRDPTQEGLKPSVTARACHQQFTQVLVDEYQDINEVQDAILHLVSTEHLASESEIASNLFCVGDVKQSIYRFRLADPERFLQKYEAYSTASMMNRGRVIPLSSNFRSRGLLLQIINQIFTRLMTKESGEIVYDESHRLQAGAVFPADQEGTFRGGPIELHLIDDSKEEEVSEEGDADRTEYEAQWVAYRLEELLRVGKVIENGKARGIRPGDCAVLLRSTLRKAEVFAKALRMRGLPVHTDKGAGLFEAMEVRDVLALLRILDNQRQDIPLAAFLRGPMGGVPGPEDALARIRIAYRDEAVPFHLAVVRYSVEKDDELAARLRDVLGQLARWRELSRERPLAEFIWTIYEETGYLVYCSGLEDGAQRVANLLHLHQRARQFGTFARQGLYSFLTFLESLEEETNASTPSVSAGGEDVVRIMSVHASKGLEFPVVVVPDLGKKHNLSDSKRSILVDRKAYVGLLVMDEEKQIKYPSLAHRLVRERIHEQTMAEELRLLYVAVTRAKEHLILVGTCKDTLVEGWERTWRGFEGALPTEAFLSAGTFLDWLGPVAYMLGQEGDETLLIERHTREEIVGFSNAGLVGGKLSLDQSRLARLEMLTPVPVETEESRRVVERLGYQYPYGVFAKLPAVLSATGWTKHGKKVAVRETGTRAIEKEFVQPLRVPKCAEDVAAVSATDRGSATHLVLQYLDFSRSCEGLDLQEQLDQLVERKLMTAVQVGMVDVEAIEWLVGSEVGHLLRGGKMWRELPFYLGMGPGEVEEGVMSDEIGDRVMIRGRIDVLVPEGEGFSVVDYKTDNISRELIEARVESYRGQVSLYREAVERITGKTLVEAYLVFLRARVVCRV